MNPEHLVEWQCPDCGAMQEDDINNTVLPCCGACETAFNWCDLKGFDHCKACHNPFEKLPSVDYCHNCFEYEKELQELWSEFMRVPVYTTNFPTITRDFHLWEEGTLHQEIWDWFEEQSPRGIHYVMYPNGDKADGT